METCWSLIVMAPRRWEGSPFVVTLKATFPSPCPDAAVPSCNQLADEVAFHEHSRFVLTVRVPPPPAAPNAAGSTATVTGHLVVEGPVTFWVEDVQPTHAPHVRITPTAVVTGRISAPCARGNTPVPARGRPSYKKHSGLSRLTFS